MPFFNLTPFLLCQPLEYFPQIPRVYTRSSYGLSYPCRPSWISFACALAARVKEFPRWTHVAVELLVPPGRTGGPPKMR